MKQQKHDRLASLIGDIHWRDIPLAKLEQILRVLEE